MINYWSYAAQNKLFYYKNVGGNSAEICSTWLDKKAMLRAHKSW